MCVCVWVYIYMYTYASIHTHTHTQFYKRSQFCPYSSGNLCKYTKCEKPTKFCHLCLILCVGFGFCYFLSIVKYGLFLTHDTACSAKHVPNSKKYLVLPSEISECSTRSGAFLAWRRKQNRLSKHRASLKNYRTTKSKKRCESHINYVSQIPTM